MSAQSPQIGCVADHLLPPIESNHAPNDSNFGRSATPCLLWSPSSSCGRASLACSAHWACWSGGYRQCSWRRSQTPVLAVIGGRHERYMRLVAVVHASNRRWRSPPVGLSVRSSWRSFGWLGGAKAVEGASYPDQSITLLTESRQLTSQSP